MAKRLTNREKEIIKELYPNTTNERISKLIGRSSESIKAFASTQGWKKVKIKIGDVFDKLEVIGQAPERSKNGDILWICQCKCGLKSKVRTYSLLSGHTTSCGCGRIEAISSNTGYISGTWYGAIKKNARVRGLDFLVTPEYLNELLIKQDHKCALSGLLIEIKSGRRNLETTASLDRIDNNLPYIEGNVQFLHKHVNYMKWTHTQEYFIGLCKIIAIKQGLISNANGVTNIH